ncbi:hypothetical protein FACS18942_00170 [Planctomycetales bacterium]|nr:hypothetical protein FACS18942_00170 [Planctomycetales bacterium]GHT31886.1 hypothetical protein FACS1894214_3530 [Planctomycetales bacterium]
MDRGQLLKEAFKREFGAGPKKSYDTFIIFFSLILLFLFLGGLIYYETIFIKQRGDLENPWVVFKELCKAHQLNRSDRLVLQRAADELDLDDPLPLFIEPRFLKSLLENKDFQTDRLTVLKLLHQFFGIEPPDRQSSIISSIKKHN